MAKDRQRPVTVLDLGAGNGWLSYRVASESHNAIAIDIREDRVDGLGAGEVFEKALPNRIRRLTASFDRLPVEVGCADLAVFNASIHYATDLFAALSEAARATRPGGRIVILDTPFYQREEHGLAMVAEKRQSADQVFGELAADLLSLPFIEFLTRERLAEASAPLGLHWRRQRVLYPIGYELRGLRARLGGQRPPSRFDLWHCLRP